jgi:pimeloyl-ACP methyl ester carboxylesterase
MPETWTALTRWPGHLRWLVGTRDDKFSAIADRVKQRLPDTLLVRVPNAGHNLLLEAPEIVRQHCVELPDLGPLNRSPSS